MEIGNVPTVAVPFRGLSSVSSRADKYCMAVFTVTDNIYIYIATYIV